MPAGTEGLGGAVAVENIGGRTEIATFPLDRSAKGNPLTWFSMFRAIAPVHYSVPASP